MRDDLVDFARHLNGIARSVLERDGEHVAMFFLRFDSDEIEVKEFEEALTRPVGDLRAREMANAVRESSANAIAFVSEAWSAPEASVLEGFSAGDAPEAQDVLLLAALDRNGNCIALETPISRLPDGSVVLGETDEQVNELGLNVFDDVRRVWGLEP